MANRKKSNYKKGFQKRGNQKPDQSTNRDKGTEKFMYDEQKTNDISWYNKDTSLFDLATRIPFNQIMGAKAPMGRKLNGVQTYSKALPGLMVLRYIPGIGVSETYQSAPNRAFQALYSTILSRTSTSALSFTPANVALIVTAEQSIAQNIAIVKRLLKAANVYAAQNLYYPRAIIAAHGISVQDTLDNRGEYTWRLNNIIRDFNSLRVPNMIDTFKRQYFLASNVFADSDLINAQLYVPIPDVFYAYSDLGSYDGSTSEYDGVAVLKAVFHPCKEPDADESIDTLLTMIEGQIELIRSSADFGLINGTLQRAFSENEFIKIDPLNVDDMLIPLPDETMAYQIHNATFAGGLLPSSGVSYPNLTSALPGVPLILAADGDIYADYVANVVKYTPHVNPTISGSAQSDEVVLNKFDSTITNDFIMESTRLISISDASGKILSCGTEICTSFDLFTLVYDDEAQDVELQKISAPFGANQGVITLPDANAGGQSITNYFMDYSKFHRAPRIYTTNREKCLGDLGFYTLVSKEAVDKLNFTALLSIFNTDSLTKSVK